MRLFCSLAVALACLPAAAAPLKGIALWPDMARGRPDLSRAVSLEFSYCRPTDTKDPKPTVALLDETPRHEAVAAILADETPVFSHVFAALEHMLSPETVFLDAPKPIKNFPH